MSNFVDRGRCLLAAPPAGAQYPSSGQGKPGCSRSALRRGARVDRRGGPPEGQPPGAGTAYTMAQTLQDAGIYLPGPLPLALYERGGVRVEGKRQDDGPLMTSTMPDRSRGPGWDLACGSRCLSPGPRRRRPRSKRESGARTRRATDPSCIASIAPTMPREKSDGSGSSREAPDPDRPTLHKKDSSDMQRRFERFDYKFKIPASDPDPAHAAQERIPATAAIRPPPSTIHQQFRSQRANFQKTTAGGRLCSSRRRPSTAAIQVRARSNFVHRSRPPHG